MIARLADHADELALADEDPDFHYELRQALFKTRRGRVCRAVYTIDSGEVYILRVRGPGQDYVRPEDVEL